jgi:carboxypeptidase T
VGSGNQDAGNPLYDGQQLSWVKEEIDLSDYLGQNIKLRFKIVSDDNTTADGFYFDDIKVSILNNTSDLNESLTTGSITVFPNPCQSVLTVVNNTSTNIFPIRIYNILGTCVTTIESSNCSQSQATIPVDGLPAGVYMIRTAGNGNSKFCKN